MSKKDRLFERNAAVRKMFNDTSDKNPKWRIDAVIEEVAKKMFLSARTVEAIVNYEGIYNDASGVEPLNKSNQLKLF